MKVFTRDSWAYWGDRIGVLVLIGGSGAFLVIASWASIAQHRKKYP